jgi:subtilisin family serine protease
LGNIQVNFTYSSINAICVYNNDYDYQVLYKTTYNMINDDTLMLNNLSVSAWTTPEGFHKTKAINSSYIQDFNGASAVAPHVLGVAALILSINPDLRYDQVSYIIESTAKKVGNYTYNDVTGRPHSTNVEYGP